MVRQAGLPTPQPPTSPLDPPAAELRSLSALSALAQRTRLNIFRLLVEHEPRGMAAGAIAESVHAPQNTVSSHLSVLAGATLVVGERRGRSIIYRANLAEVGSVLDYLIANCCEGKEHCEVSLLNRLRAAPQGMLEA